MDAADREEFLAIASALRAHVERCAATGATGVPRWSGAARADAPPDQIPVRAPAGLGGAAALAPPPPTATGRAVRPALPAEPATPTTAGVVPPGPAAASPGSGATTVARGPDVSRLHVLQSAVKGCTGCQLHAGRTQTVFSRGTGASGLCFVGEGPGAEEDATGEPFVGKAGQLLDRMIEAMGLTRDEVYVCNVVKCRPPENRKPETAEIAACAPHLAGQLEAVAPSVIVALGATAVEGLLGLRGGITRLRGEWRLYRGAIPVMPTFHPAYLLRTPSAKRVVWEDMKKVVEQLGLRVPPRR